MINQIKISVARELLVVTSEPYVIYTRRGYTPVIDVEHVHTGIIGCLVITAISLAEPLHMIQEQNGGSLAGVSLSIQKENKSRMAAYIVERLD